MLYEAKIEESEKAGSHKKLNPRHLACAASALPLRLKCLSRTPGSHSVCAIRTPLGVDCKILSIRREPMLSSFLSLYA